MFHKEITSDPDIRTTLKKWSESGKERMFSKHRTVFPVFLNGGRSSMFFILRFFDVFPREKDWYEWNCELCHVFG